MRRFNEEIFKSHSYSLTSLGNEKSLKKMTTDQIMRKYEKALANHKITITICGDVPLDDIFTVFNRYKELFKYRVRNSFKIRPTLDLPQKKSSTRLTFDREQTHIMMGVKSKPTFHPESIALKMLTTYLSGQSSVLFVEVRDRLGLCYTAQPIHFHGIEGGYWGIYIGTSHEKEEKAQKAILAIIEDIKNGSITKEEYDQIKKMIKGQNMLNIQTNDDYASIYSIPFLHGMNLDFFYTQQNAIESLTYERFQKTIKQVLSRKWIEVLAGK